jgi:hypothetical protein
MSLPTSGNNPLPLGSSSYPVRAEDAASGILTFPSPSPAASPTEHFTVLKPQKHTHLDTESDICKHSTLWQENITKINREAATETCHSAPSNPAAQSIAPNP